MKCVSYEKPSTENTCEACKTHFKRLESIGAHQMNCIKCLFDRDAAYACRATNTECILMLHRNFTQYLEEGNIDLYYEEIPHYKLWLEERLLFLEHNAKLKEEGVKTNSAWILIELNEGILGSTSLHKTEKEAQGVFETMYGFPWSEWNDPDSMRTAKLKENGVTTEIRQSFFFRGK